MTQKTVFVTGGTGFTGQYLLRHLCQEGFIVRAIRRKNTSVDALADLSIQWVVGEITDETILAKAMDGVQQVYHLAAVYRATNVPDEMLHQVHVQSTKLLANLALQQTNFERFVLVSTVGVLGHIETPPADENTAYNPGDLYQSTKAQAEQWLIEFASHNALPYTVVRPAAIYGPGDRRLLKFFKLAKLPIIPLIGDSEGLYHLIHVEDLVSFMHFVTTIEQAKNNIYICGNPKVNSLAAMFETISTHLGKKARFIRIPAAPLFFIAKWVQWLSKKMKVEPILYPRRVAFFTKDRSFNTEKMQSLSGYQYKYDEKAGLEQLTNWYQEQGWL